MSDLDMGSHVIKNLETPTNPKDGANKSFVDTRAAMGKYDGSFNLNLANKKIINLGNPTIVSDAANKRYVDDSINKIKTSSRTGNLDMGNYKVINSAAPTDNGDLTNKQHVDSAVSKAKPTGLLPLSGGTMRGNIDMGGELITSVGTATSNSGVPNKLQVEGIAKTATSDRDMKGYKITNLGDPISTKDAVNLGYTSSFVKNTGGTVNDNLTVNGEVISKGRISHSNAALDKYAVDARINTAGFDKDMGSKYKIVNLPNPTNSRDAATKFYVDTAKSSVLSTASSTYLPKSGGTMTGNINLNGKR